MGGNAAGAHIFARATAKGKRVQANLGAKNHATVLPDADKVCAHFCVCTNTLIRIDHMCVCAAWGSMTDACYSRYMLPTDPSLMMPQTNTNTHEQYRSRF